jgi:hypothetical protein
MGTTPLYVYMRLYMYIHIHIYKFAYAYTNTSIANIICKYVYICIYIYRGYSHRRDYRRERRVFSVDPPGCQDIDDAMSVHWVYTYICLHICM